MARHEDYERTNAREWDMSLRENSRTNGEGSSTAELAVGDDWQVVRGKKHDKSSENSKPTKGKGKQKTSPTKKNNWTNPKRGRVIEANQRRPQPNLLVDISNDAENAWRNREQPTDTVRISDVLALQDSHYKSIAEQHGTFIYSGHAKGINGSMNFSIWGDKEAVAATKRAVLSWDREWRNASTSKSHRSAAFAKIVSLTPILRERAEKAWLREVVKQKFRQHPPYGSEFGAIGTFHWPSNEYRPEEVLGNSYEALDPIRIEYHCYVVFIEERSVFQISGRADNVKEGLLRLRKTCFQIAARSMPTIRAYFLHWPEATVLPSHVRLQTYEHTRALSSDTPGIIGNVPVGEGELDNESTLEPQTTISENRVQGLLMQTLKKLHYYRGNIQMRIRLGKFLAIQFRQPKDGRYELDQYEDMIKESQFVGEVTEELGDRSKESAALAAIRNSDKLLQPEDAITETLAAVRPVYSVTFTFADESGDISLTMSWRGTEDAGAAVTSFETISKKWTRLERDTGAAVPLADISLCDLNTGMAWQFDIQASQAIEERRLSEKLVEFGHSVKIDSKAALNLVLCGGSNSIVAYKPYSGMKLKHLRQSLGYRYHIRDKNGFVTGYTLDLTRFQDRSFPVQQQGTDRIVKGYLMPPAAAEQPTIYEPRWSLNVSRSEWGVTFAANENLKIGEKAEWVDGMKTWFPEDLPKGDKDEDTGTGFEDLTENLKRIGSLMRDVKQDDLLSDMSGMTVS